MVITGGRSKNIQDILPTEIYDTESSEWMRFHGIGLYRHMVFKKDNNLFIYGGFENNNPNYPIERIFKVDLLQYFKTSSLIIKKIENYLAGLKEKANQKTLLPSNETFQEQVNIQNNHPQQNVFRLAPKAVVIKNDEIVQVRKVDINSLNEERKRIGFNINTPSLQDKRIYNEPLINKFIEVLFHPFDWFKNEVEMIHNKLPFTKDEIDTLISEATKVISKEPSLVRVKSPAKVFGNIFGQYNDLMRFFESFGHPTDDNTMGDVHLFQYIFLGDYVDRGHYSLEVIFLLLALKVNYFIFH